jgi:hypothetical protein
MKITSLEFVLVTGLGLLILSTLPVSAQPLTKDTPTGNLTGEIDISIDPAEPLPANGTATISTEGASDTDLNGFPPEGVYVIISSDTVIVTNQSVDIETADEENGGTGSVGGFNEGTGSVGGFNEGTGSVGGSDDDDEAGGDDDGSESVGGSDDDDEAGGDD